LRARGCPVTGIDLFPPDASETYDAFHRHDLNEMPLPVSFADFDTIVMLDVIEHLAAPERFVEALRNDPALTPDKRLLLSTGNVAFGITRLQLLLGQFNYGKRGILDLTHTRLFTIRTITRLFEQAGFSVTERQGIPAPFPLALGEKSLVGRFLLRLNQLLIRVWPQFFAYQVFLEIRNRPTLTQLLDTAVSQSAERARKTD
jgi:hypothetical protein